MTDVRPESKVTQGYRPSRSDRRRAALNDVRAMEANALREAGKALPNRDYDYGWFTGIRVGFISGLVIGLMSASALYAVIHFSQ